MEFGEIPVKRKGARNHLSDLYDMIKQDMTSYKIMEECPDYMLQLDKIQRVRQRVREETFKNTFREIQPTYIWGATGAGNTRSIMERYGYENVFRITDYAYPFDTHKGQDIIIFEKFRKFQICLYIWKVTPQNYHVGIQIKWRVLQRYT